MSAVLSGGSLPGRPATGDAGTGAREGSDLVSSNGSMSVAGHVSAYCSRCRREVFVPADSMRCPYGNHDVEGTSLPRTPRETVAAVAAPLPSQLAPTPSAEHAPAEAKAGQAGDRVVLPDWMKEAQAWITATERFAKALAAEDVSLTADVRQ